MDRTILFVLSNWSSVRGYEGAISLESGEDKSASGR